MENLKTMLEDVVTCYRGKAAIVSGDSRISYSNLEESSNSIAHSLLQLGVDRGDRVAILLDNSPQFVHVFFGIVKTGAIAVPLDTKYKARELECLLEHCQPKVLFAESAHLKEINTLLAELKYIKHIICLGDNASDEQFVNYEEIIAKASTKFAEVDIKPEDIACIMYTSGPALKPKGAELSHMNLIRAITISADGFQQSNRDIVALFALPMHHIVGLIIILLTSISRGSTVVILSDLSISGLMQVIERERITIFIGVPFIHALMVKKVKEVGITHDLSSLRICGSIGAPLSRKIAQQFDEYVGFKLVDFYGLTESTAHVTLQSLNGSGKPDSVGKVLPGWEIKIVDARNRQVPANQSGEVIIRGPIMSSYYNSPCDTAEMIKNGWLYTSDIGRMDEEGNLFLTGLKKDMIIAKGQNIYPSDIETVLLDHPKISDAAVTGIQDEMRGEVVGAAIVLKAGEITTEREIKNFCLERMANFKVPKKVIFVDSLPRTEDDRINKEIIKENLMKIYTASEDKGMVEY